MGLKTLFVVAAVATVAHAEYLKVAGECSLLQSPQGFFDQLLGCADYVKVDGSLDCLTPEKEAALVKTVPEWTLVKDPVLGDKLVRSFNFKDFIEAFSFMAQGAQLAQKNEHHPLWTNIYNQVNVTLTTDDKACLSSYDVDFASGLNAVFAKF